MNKIIRTGFEKINHCIEFQPQTEPKGKALVKSGHVMKVEEVRIQHHTSIRASVIRQASVTSDPYIVKLSVSFLVFYKNLFACKVMIYDIIQI